MSIPVDVFAEVRRPAIPKHTVIHHTPVVHQICRYLDPFDLLQMARANRRLRSLLMSRSERMLWRLSRENLEGLPECPEDLSDPQFTELLFGKSCYVCV